MNPQPGNQYDNFDDMQMRGCHDSKTDVRVMKSEPKKRGWE